VNGQKERKEKGIITQFKEKWKTKNEVAATNEDNRTKFTKKKSNLPVPYEKKKKPFWDNKYVYVGASVIALIFLIGNLTGAFDFSTSTSAEPKEQPEELQEDKLTIASDELLNVYRKGIIGNIEEALEQLERYGYDNLSEEDKSVMLTLYQKTSQSEKAIKLEPTYAETVVNDLIADEKLDELKALKEKVNNHPLINYEVAYIEENWGEVIQLKDQVELTETREQQVLTAYLRLGEIEEAKQFTSQQEKPELIQRIEDYQAKKKQVEDLKEKIADVEKNEKDEKKREKEVKELQDQVKQAEEALQKI
jgi:hypothetical protein